MKILLTGSNGFLGNNILQKLKEYDITTLTRNDLDLCNTEETDLFFSNNKFDVVIHCAIDGGNRLLADESSCLYQNTLMALNLQKNKSSFKKLIHFGSGAEKQDTFYGLGKKVINESIQNKDNFHNIRIFAVFDENENDARFVKTNINKYINKEDMEIFVNKYMDFFYMEDLISVVKYYIKEANPGKSFNCTYLESKTLLQIAEMINHLDKHRVGIGVLKDGFGKGYIGSWDGLILPLVGLEQGIRNTYNIIKSQL